MPQVRDNDPIIIRDYSNDVEIICGRNCIFKYLGMSDESEIDRQIEVTF
jgi:hypothetical protein